MWCGVESRRLEVRCGQKTKDQARKLYVHMLNGTLCATERALCCLVENYQTPDVCCPTIRIEWSIINVMTRVLSFPRYCARTWVAASSFPGSRSSPRACRGNRPRCVYSNQLHRADVPDIVLRFSPLLLMYFWTRVYSLLDASLNFVTDRDRILFRVSHKSAHALWLSGTSSALEEDASSCSKPHR